ncbi:DNA-binding protein [Kaistella haifensis]|nr:DNA-binding protein [Kaistella haifensis]
MNNPFETLQEMLAKIDQKIDRLDQKTKELPERNYTVKEVAQILKMTNQTVRKKIELGIIEADTNTKPFLIPHSALYNEKNQLKKLKYVS